MLNVLLLVGWSGEGEGAVLVVGEWGMEIARTVLGLRRSMEIVGGIVGFECSVCVSYLS